ncbi:MAG: GHKL domain-containing protein [Lachnospiraceae bacterium]|nr:GHKL domain-containing protein [Lachnospiraceae bacterium]
MRKKTFLKLAEYQTEQSRRHLDDVRSIHKEMRAYKHDFHHHLQTLRNQLEAGEYDRALAYIDELDSNLLKTDTLLKTGNVALDAILSGKIAQAKAKQIEITVKANVPDQLTISDVELSILIGNLLDNAIESCEQLAETKDGSPFIRIFIGMKGEMLYFSMLNSAGAKQKKLSGLFATGKAGLHGFGLRRAESIIEEHGGWCKYNSEDGAFTSEFLVPAL